MPRMRDINMKPAPTRHACPAGGKPRNRQQGFALIATISVMILLIMTALAMLSLSSIEMRASQQGKAQAEANANARLSLMLALGQLQKMAGPDQRITSTTIPGSSANPTERTLTGVWKSREENLAKKPDYEKGQDAFVGWLTSSAINGATEQLAYRASNMAGKSVNMLSPTQPIQAEIVTAPMGGLAWLCYGQNSKAKVNTRQHETIAAPDIATTLESFATPTANGLAMASIFTNATRSALPSDKAVSYRSLGLFPKIDKAELSNSFHDFTTSALSLPVNVTSNSITPLKRDMNLMLEQQNVPTPDGTTSLYNHNTSGFLTWRQLQQHYNLPKLVRYDNGRPTVEAISFGKPHHVTKNPWLSDNSIRIQQDPVKVMMVFSYSTQKLRSSTGEFNYRMLIHVYPLVAIWNPYNVDLVVPELTYFMLSIPLELKFNVGGEDVTIDTRSLSFAGGHAGGWCVSSGKELGYAEPVLKPGESRVLYQRDQSLPDSPKKFELRVHYYSLSGADYNIGPNKPGDRRIIINKLETNTGPATATTLIKTEMNLAKGNYGVVYQNWSNPSWSYASRNGWHYAVDGGHMEKSGYTSVAGFMFEDDSRAVRLNGSGSTVSRSVQALVNNPTPFAVVEAHIKAADEVISPNKPWVHADPTYPYIGTTLANRAGKSTATIWHSQPQDCSLTSVNGWDEIAEKLQIDPNNPKKLWFGSSYSPKGQTNVTSKEIPLTPISSLAQLQHVTIMSNYQAENDSLQQARNFPAQSRQYGAIGNSFANPGIPANQYRTIGWEHTTIHGDWIQPDVVDYSYVANSLLWDQYFCSTIAAHDNSTYAQTSQSKSLKNVLRDFVSNNEKLANPRYVFTNTEEPETVVATLVSNTGHASPTAYENAAAYLAIDGGFNVNSTSVKAWKTFLGSALRDHAAYMDDSGFPSVNTPATDNYFISRYSLANRSPANAKRDPARWDGIVPISEVQLGSLATEIVKQVKTRGPFRSLGEFINRRLSEGSGASNSLSLYGALQAAIEKTNINKEFKNYGPVNMHGAEVAYPAAAEGPTAQGAPGYLTQADLLQSIGSLITVRDDTFVIRGYGEATNNKGIIIARAWCEANVQRGIVYIDPANEADAKTAELTPVNTKFGRRFRITDFRWMSKKEIMN